MWFELLLWIIYVLCSTNIFLHTWYKSFLNTETKTNNLEESPLKLLSKHELKNITIVLETTGTYSPHIATYLLASSKLIFYNALVYLINPKISRNYNHSFTNMDKKDPKDSFILADPLVDS